MLTVGPSLITAPEVSLFTEIETILGPVWVALAGYEKPPPLTLVGGIILLVALTVHSILTLREMQIENKKKTTNAEKYIEINRNGNDDDKL